LVDVENKGCSEMKKSSYWLVIAAFVLILAGCSNMKQINRIAFITALGIDKSETGVKVYALAAVPGRYASLSPGAVGTGGKSPNYILSAEGRDVAEALYTMKRKAAEDIQFGHAKIFLFSADLAKQGLGSSLDLFMRRAEFQTVSWLGITQGSVKSIFEIIPEDPETVSDSLVDIFSQTGSETFEVLPIYMFEFYSLSAEPGQSPYMMMVKKDKENNKVEVANLAIFKKDRMVGILIAEETKILQLLQKNKLRSTSITVDSATFNLMKYRTKIKVKQHQISIQLQLELELDQNLIKNPLNTSQQLHLLEQQVNESIQLEIKQLVSKLQQLKSDPAGFGEYYRTAVKGGFMKTDDWENVIFPEMSTDVIVNSRILRRGIIK
jgi:Ger(x)C family germination protein